MNETETLRRIAEAVHGYDATECMTDHQRRLADVVAALATAELSGVHLWDGVTPYEWRERRYRK